MPWPIDKLASSAVLDVETIRADFPIFKNGAASLSYLDNAATSQKPNVVIDAITNCYRQHYAPVHRGLYPLAEQASEHYEQARMRIARFIGSPSPEQLVFTRSATESLNMVAQGWLRPRLQPGDSVWVSRMEHHANFLPWQRVCQETGAVLQIIELNADGTLDLEGADGLYGPKTRLIALSHVSNVLGTVNPIKKIVARAALQGIPVVVDAAQSVGHMPVDVNELGCDFLAISAHKMCGPGGIGALYAKTARLEEMEPLLVGGGMVDQVSESECHWLPYPAKFEAGSPNLADAIAFAAAADYLDNIGMPAIQHHIETLTGQLLQALLKMPDIQLYHPVATGEATGIVAFNLADIHPHDVGQVLGEQNVAIRAGHHCCQPLMDHLGVAATARASFALYNRHEDVEALVAGIATARRMFSKRGIS